MRADPYPLRQVLSWERRYVIPTFQRDYEWTKDEQWELLADDLEAVAERLGAERHHAEVTGSTAAHADEKVSPHFLGAIVLDRMVPTRAGGLDLRSVIDGQQRLTTLQLLVRAILDVAIERDSARVRQLRRLLRNPEDVADTPEEVHKLWPRRRDRVVWTEAMADEPASEPDSHRYLEARAYFGDRVRSAVAESEDAASSLELLIDAALDMFRVVVIDLDDNDDAQVIFEVLNGRQTPLSSADLVKNLLFLRAEQQDVADVEQLYADHWEQFDDDWWKTNVGRGHAARRHTSIMLSSWLTAVSDQAAHPDRLYGQVRRHVDHADAKVPDVLAQISAYASHYRSYQGLPAESEDRVAVAFDRLRALGANTALPVILWLRNEKVEGRLDAEGYRRSIIDVESYLVRRVAVGANTRAYNTTFREVLLAIRAYDGPTADGVRAALADLEGNAAWPTDAELRVAFQTRRYYDNVAQYVIRLLLGGIEEQMRFEQKHTEQVSVDYDTLTIEHVLPKKWATNWAVAGSGAARTLAEQERQAHVDRIGNLTLINGTLNASQSNKPWSEKRQELRKFSSLRLNVDLAQSDRWATWDEEAITARAAALAEVAARVWPAPSAVGGVR